MVDFIDTIVYAGRVKDKLALMESSSGGAFTVLYDYFLNHGNTIAAVVYNYENYLSEYLFIQKKTERDFARGSKYMQSKPEDICKEAYQWINENLENFLLFVGMDYQIDGFKKYAELEAIRDQVYIINTVCHGFSSLKLWKEYVKLIERRKGGKVIYLSFKDKWNGWKVRTVYVVINEKEVPINDYVKMFYNHCALRESFHICPFATTERKTDITIEAFWHIKETIPDFYDFSRNSLFQIHTDRGEKLFERVKESPDYRLSDIKQCRQSNLETPTPASDQREKFREDYQRGGIDYIMKKCRTDSLKKRAKNIIPKIVKGEITSSWSPSYADYFERRVV